MAMFLIKHGANPNLAADGNGATPLWAAVNTQWQPRTRFPQPQEMEQQKATYLDVMKALLDAGADPDARIEDASLVPGLQRLRQPQLRPRRHVGLDRFWRAAYATDLDAMKLLVAYGADPEHPDASRRRRAGRAVVRRAGARCRAPARAPGGAIAPTRRRRPAKFDAPPVPAGGPGALADSRRGRRRVRRRLRRQRASPRARRVADGR